MLNINIGNDLVDLSAPRTNCKHLDLRFIKRVFSSNEQLAINQSTAPATTLWAIWAAKEAAFKAGQQYNPSLIFALNRFEVTTESLWLLSSQLTTNKGATKRQPKNEPHKEIFGCLIYNNLIFALKWLLFKNSILCLAVLTTSNNSKQTSNNYFKDWYKVNYNVFKIVPKFLPLNLAKLRVIKKYFNNLELSSIFSQESLQTRYYAKKFICSYYKEKEQTIEIIRPNIIINNIKRLGPPVIQINKGNIKSTIAISLTHDGSFGAVATILP